MIYDIFTFNGEYDLLEIRLNILDKFVDQFIIVEAPTTFSGKSKPLYYKLQEKRYAKWFSKIRYYVLSEDYSPEEVLVAVESPNTQGAAHWKHEFLQKESIKKALEGLNDNDICFIGDVDEIWNPKVLKEAIPPVAKLSQKMYCYYLNNRSTEEWYGTIVARYKDIKNACLNHLRSHSNLYKEVKNDGWHFTSLHDILKRKLEDSYTEESYATPWVMEHLKENIEHNKDWLGRPFTYTIDEIDLPKYILDNKAKYRNLFK